MAKKRAFVNQEQRYKKAKISEVRKKVTVVVPTKNEEKNIALALGLIKKYADDILLVDAHSEDKTVKIAKKFGVKIIYDHGKGKGEALRCAIKKVKKPIIVFIDADGSHDPADIPKLIYPIIHGQADHVTGSRMLGGSDELHGDSNRYLRMIGGETITWLTNQRFGTKLTDSQNGFRAIRTRVARKLNLKENITTIEQEMVIKTLKKGYHLAEVPAHEYEREFGDSHIVLRKVWLRYIYSAIKYLFFD